MDHGFEIKKVKALFSKNSYEPVSCNQGHDFQMDGREWRERDGGRRRNTWTVAPWPDLGGGSGFDILGHHRAQEDYAEQEKLKASSMEGSEGAAMA